MSTCDWIWKTQFPYTQYQTYGFGLLAQYTIIFHWELCSKLTSLVYVAAFPRPCVSLSGALEPLAGHGFLVLIVRHGQATKGWPMSWMLWAKARSTRTPNWTFGYQSSLFSILYPYIEPIATHHPYFTTTCNIITLEATQESLNFRCLKVIYPHNYG